MTRRFSGSFPRSGFYTRLLARAVVLLCVTPAALQAQTTAVFLDSEAGDAVGKGLQATLLPAAGLTFQFLNPQTNHLSLSVSGPGQTWSFRFTAQGGEPLQVGAYEAATRDLTSSSPSGHVLSVSGNGVGCNSLTGRYVIREFVKSASTIERLAIDFEQHCNDAIPGLFGAIRFNSTVGSLVPFDGDYPVYRLDVTATAGGRVTGEGLDCREAGSGCVRLFPSAQDVFALTAAPDAGFMFTGWSGVCHGGLTISIRVNMRKRCAARFVPIDSAEPALWFSNSQRGDFVGQGRRAMYDSVNASWAVSPTLLNQVVQGVTVNIFGSGANDGYDWRLWYRTNGDPLVPGTYSFSSDTAVVDQLWVTGYGGCGLPWFGTFVLHEIEVSGAAVTKLAADFEQHCGNAISDPPKPLVGSVRINSTVPIQPSLAVVVNPGGEVDVEAPEMTCAAACMLTYGLGGETRVIARANPGVEFIGWKGDEICGSVMVMTAPVACEATFRTTSLGATAAPVDGSAALQTFTFTYASPLGTADLATGAAWFAVAANGSAAGSCQIEITPGSSVVRLRNDADTAWLSSVVGGADVQNSQCRIALASSAVALSGNTVTVTLALRFKQSFIGDKRIFVQAVSKGGATTGWQERGAWTIPEPRVTSDRVTPASGSGNPQLFTLDYSHTFGGVAIETAWAWFSATLTGSAAQSCLVYFDRTTNLLQLLNDAGTTWQSASLGSAATLQNSQCAIALGASITTVDGPTRRLTLSVAFADVYAGTKNIYLYASSIDGLNTGWQDKGDWTVVAQVPPEVSAVSASPNAGSGNGTFAFTYSSSLGTSDIATAWVWFNPSSAASAAQSCLVRYERAEQTLYLLNDVGTAWIRATSPFGVAGADNSQCSVGLASVTTQADVVTLTLSISFAQRFHGTKNIYLYASGFSGVNSGWQDRGDWTIPVGVGAESVSPATGSGARQAFTFTWSNTGTGLASGIPAGWVWFNDSFSNSSAASCLFYYERSLGRISLLNDAGTAWQSAAIGSATILQNSQCALELRDALGTVQSSRLRLTVTVRFKPLFAGAKNSYLYAAGPEGASSGWQDLGDWTVPEGQALMVRADAVSPAAGEGASQRFTLTYSNTIGAEHLSSTWVWFNDHFAQSAAGSCLLYYDADAMQLRLLDDAGTSWLSSGLTLATRIENSQCSVYLGGSTSSVNGPTRTLTLEMTFKPAFAGEKNIYLYAGAFEANSGWHDRGDWVVPGAITVGDVVPGSGTGTTQFFQFSYVHAAGSDRVSTAWVWFNSALAPSPAGSCLLYYDRALGTMNLVNDAGTAWLSAPVGGGPLQNSQCTVGATSIGHTVIGKMWVSTTVTFSQSFSGQKNVYLYATDATSNTGWRDRGDWTVP